MELDRGIIDKIKFGDLESFKKAFDYHYAELVNYANSILKDRDEAEDKVQQVYITLWEKRESLEIHTSLRAFLYKAVHNACLNRIKQQKVRTKYAEGIKMTAVRNFEENGIEEKELRNKIDQAIITLPEQCQKIFRMSRFDNLKYQEIADELNLSVKTIENQMGKALKIMREQLKDYLPILILLFS